MTSAWLKLFFLKVLVFRNTAAYKTTLAYSHPIFNIGNEFRQNYDGKSVAYVTTDLLMLEEMLQLQAIIIVFFCIFGSLYECNNIHTSRCMSNKNKPHNVLPHNYEPNVD